MPNFIVSRWYKVPPSRRRFFQSIPSRNMSVIEIIYKKWREDPSTLELMIEKHAEGRREIIRTETLGEH